jgi:hypothetical protein
MHMFLFGDPPAAAAGRAQGPQVFSIARKEEKKRAESNQTECVEKETLRYGCSSILWQAVWKWGSFVRLTLSASSHFYLIKYRLFYSNSWLSAQYNRVCDVPDRKKLGQTKPVF